MARQRERLFASAERGRPEVGHETWHQVDVRVGGESYRLRVAQSRGGALPRGAGRRRRVDVDVPSAPGRFERKLTVGGRRSPCCRCRRARLPRRGRRRRAPHLRRRGRAGPRARRRRWSCRSRSRPATRSTAGDVVAVVESMKLETALRAPVAGRVAGGPGRAEHPGRGRHEAGAAGAGRRRRRGRRLRARDAGRASPRRRSAGRPTPATVAADALTSLRYLVLGYDIDERDARPLLAALAAARQDLPPDDPARAGRRDRRAADLRRPLRAVAQPARRPRTRRQQVDPAGEEARNPQEYLYAYLRSRDADAEGLPESFRAKLRRALAHYGVPDLEPASGRAVPRALYRMFLAHRRAAAHVPVLLDLLQLAAAPPRLAARRRPRALPAGARPPGQRHPAAAPRGRRPRPARALHLLRRPADRRRAGAGPAGRCATSWTTLVRRPGRAGRADRRASSRRPSRSSACSGGRHHAVMLEVMTRRYYRVRELDRRPGRATAAGGPLLTAHYTHDGHAAHGARHHRAHRAGRARGHRPDRPCRATCAG